MRSKKTFGQIFEVLYSKKTHWNDAVTASRKAYNHLCFRFPIDVAHTESNASVDENLEGSSMSDE